MIGHDPGVQEGIILSFLITKPQGVQVITNKQSKVSKALNKSSYITPASCIDL